MQALYPQNKRRPFLGGRLLCDYTRVLGKNKF